MSYNRGLAMLPILKDGFLGDTIFLPQTLTQQQIGCRTGLPSLFVLELQCLLPALFRQQGQCRLKVEMSNIVIQVKHPVPPLFWEYDG